MMPVRCECGQQFAPVNLSGERRTACPFCRAPVHLEPVLEEEGSREAIARRAGAGAEAATGPTAAQLPAAAPSPSLEEKAPEPAGADPRTTRRFGIAMLVGGMAVVAMPLAGLALRGSAVAPAAAVIGAVLMVIGGIATAASFARISAASTVALTKAVLYVVMALMALVPPLAVLAVVLSMR